MRRAVAALGMIILAVVAIPAASAQQSGRCADAYPEAQWDRVTGASVAIYASAVPIEQQRRFAEEIDAAVAWIVDEMGPVDGTVCLVDEASQFDRERYLLGSAQFHAAVVADDGIVAVSTSEQLGRVGAAATFGLVHLRLWQESGGSGWPEPLATAIAHWYRTRLLDRLDLRHAEARVANFFTDTSQVDWGGRVQQATLLWDPGRNDSAIGDLVAHAVAAEGTAVLLDADAARWAAREERWRIALRTELTGREGPTTTWISGVVLAIAVVLVAAGIAVLGFWSKRRILRKRPTPPPLPGFFDRDERPAVDSAGDRR
jgi:hypothetical protein